MKDPQNNQHSFKKFKANSHSAFVFSDPKILKVYFKHSVINEHILLSGNAFSSLCHHNF